MPYEYLDDQVTADVTFRAWGNDLVELFVAAADATANVMVDSLGSICATTTKRVDVEAEALDMLLLRFLDELIFHKDAAGLILRAGAIRIDASAAFSGRADFSQGRGGTDPAGRCHSYRRVRNRPLPPDGGTRR
jgi:SHS2 domain-containing protein